MSSRNAEDQARTKHPQKRSAAEPAGTLIELEQPAAPAAKRPMSTTLGAMFVLGRGLAGLLWAVAFALSWPDLVASEKIDADAAQIVFWIIMGAILVGVLALLLLAWAIWRGSNFARVLVMLSLTVSIITAAVGYFANGEEITIRTTLLTVSFDILVLLALSSNDSRAWARRGRSPRVRGARGSRR
jgi:hypothetical protein